MIRCVLFLMFVSVLLSPAIAARLVTVDDAYSHLTGSQTLYPSDASPDDIEALRILRENPAQTSDFFVRRLSKGALRHGLTELLCIRTLTSAELMTVVRTVVATYGPADKSTPFLGYLTVNGEKQDMEILKKFIQVSPDSPGAIAQSALMAQDGNPAAQAALWELRDVPGKWQDSFYVKKFFSRPLPESVPQGENTSPRKDEQVKSLEAGASELKRQAPVGEVTLRETLSDSRWWLAGGVALVTASAAIFLLRRRHRS
jgi:hypothetical protein